MTLPTDAQYTPRRSWPYLRVLAHMLLLYAALFLPAGLWAWQAEDPLRISDLRWFQALVVYYCIAYLLWTSLIARLGWRIWRDGRTPHPSQWLPFPRRIRHGAWARAAAAGHLVSAALMLAGFAYAWHQWELWSLLGPITEASPCPPAS